MSRRRNNLILLCAFIAWIGLTPGVFAVDLADALKQSANVTESMSSLFAGKKTVSNLYNRTLRVVKQNETFATQQAISMVVKYFTDQQCQVSANDVLRVFYASNFSFKSFFDHLILSDTSSSRVLPSADSITASYDRFFACKGIKNPVVSDYTNLHNDISRLYYQALQTVFYSTTLAQSNFGEDLFRNGDSDDSAFDLLVDINDVGNLLFTSFTTAPETLFYKLPTIDGAGGGGGEGNGGLMMENGGGGNLPDSYQNMPSVSKPTLSSMFPAVYEATPTPLVSDKEQPQISEDADVQQFVTTTNPSSFAQSDFLFVLGNQCVETATPLPSLAAEAEETITDEEYISGLVDFIENADINEIINENLMEDFSVTYQELQRQNPDPETQGSSIANAYAEMAFGNGLPSDGSCESNCLGLSEADQMQCQLACAKSCIAACDGLSPRDKILCIVDCSCFMVSGPNGDARDNMESMFDIKFCKVPVEKTDVPAKTVVSGLQAILQHIADAMQGLKSSGQTIKMKKTKEFLDIGIKLNLAELLDFKILFSFKPIFAKKSDITKKREKVQENAKATDALVGNTSPDTENYNRYVIVADVAKNLESLEGSQSSADFAVVAAAQSKNIEYPILIQQQAKSAFLADNMIQFLSQHQQFRDIFISSLMDMLQDAVALQAKIEKSE